MTKKFAIVLALFLIAVVCSAGCIDPQEPVDPVVPVDPIDPITPVDPVVPVDPAVPVEEYSVMFMLNYDDAGAYSAETVKAGETVSKPASPSRSGYTFKGWFTAAEGGAEYDFTQAVNADVKLYAQWSKKSSGSSGGHSHSYSWNVVKAANCTVDGQGQYVCSCGQVKSTEAIPATGHLETEEVVNAVGDTEVKCKACGLVLVTIPASNELEIRTVEDLKAFADTVNAGTDYAGKTVKLVYDLNLQNEEWIPIGSSGNLFAGTFEGNGKTILNLKITGTEDVGFFGVLYGTVKNLNLDGVTITGNKNLGAIVGYGKGGSVEGCTVTNAEITAIPNAYESSFDNGDDVGGIVGFCYNGNDGDFDVSGCTVSDSTLTAFRDVGGIVGSANGDDVSGNSISNVDIIVDKVTNKYDRADINGAAVVGRVLSGELVAQGTVDDWTVTIIYADGFQKVTDDEGTITFEISTANGLRYFGEQISTNNATFKNTEIKLLNDISLADAPWTPMKAWNPELGGTLTFNGNGKTISGMSVIGGSEIGFIGTNSLNWMIKDVTFKDANVVTSGSFAGVVIGNQYGTVTMSDVEVVDSTVSTTAEKGIRLGGLVGGSQQETGNGAKLTLEDCTVDGLTINGFHNVGGFVGSTVRPIEAGSSISDGSRFTVNDCEIKNSQIIYTATGGIGGHYLAAGTSGYNDAAWTGNGITVENVNIIGSDGFKKETNDEGKVTITTSETTSLVALSSLTESAEPGDIIVLGYNVEGSATTTNGYGNPVGMIVSAGATLDGNGNKLDIDAKFMVQSTGGTVKNLVIDSTSGERGIVSYSPTENVVLNNVYIDGPGYAFNSAEHGAVKLLVTDSTLNGWTSFAGFTDATFTKCNFGENTKKYWQNMGYDQDYDRLIRPYVTTIFDGCTFEQDFYIDLSALGSGCTVTIKDCTVNSAEITGENYNSLITIELPSGRTLAECVIFE